MAQALLQVPTQNSLQYTLGSQYSVNDTTITANSSLASVIQYPGICVIDRVDSNGATSATKRTYYKFTGVSGSQLTGVTLADGTDQAHSVGAILEFVPDVKWAQSLYDGLTQVVVASTGVLDTTKVVDLTTAQTLTTKTLTSPKIGTSFLDTNGNELAKLTATASAINEVTLANGAINNGPIVSATGDDTNIDLNLKGKGTGNVRLGTALLKFPNADGSANQVLKTDGSGVLAFTSSQATIIAPNSIVANDGAGNLTTSGTTELTLISKTITNPSTAGQILITAQFNAVSITVAGDEFQVRLYGPDAALKTSASFIASATTQRYVMTLNWQGAVANSGTQTISMRVVRIAGTGTSTFETGKQALTWTIFPGASTTA